MGQVKFTKNGENNSAQIGEIKSIRFGENNIDIIKKGYSYYHYRQLLYP